MLTQFFQACFSDFYRGFYYSTLVIAAFVSMLYYKKVEKAFQWLCILIVLTCISELTAKYFYIHQQPNGLVYHIFTPIEYFIYTKIFNLFFIDKKWVKYLFLSSLLLAMAAVINIVFFDLPNEVPVYTIYIENVMLVYLSLLLFINIREKPVYENILNEGIFWFNSAVLIYYSYNVLIWALYAIKYKDDMPRVIGNLLLLSSAFLYITYALSVLLNRSLKKKLISKNV